MPNAATQNMALNMLELGIRAMMPAPRGQAGRAGQNGQAIPGPAPAGQVGQDASSGQNGRESGGRNGRSDRGRDHDRRRGGRDRCRRSHRRRRSPSTYSYSYTYSGPSDNEANEQVAEEAPGAHALPSSYWNGPYFQGDKFPRGTTTLGGMPVGACQEVLHVYDKDE